VVGATGRSWRFRRVASDGRRARTMGSAKRLWCGGLGLAATLRTGAVSGVIGGGGGIAVEEDVGDAGEGAAFAVGEGGEGRSGR
jgi:hypothetical protein